MTLPLSNENGLVGFLPPTISGSGSGVTGSSDSSLTIAGSDAIINQAITPTWTGAHVFQASDAGTATTLRTLTVRRMTSGTAAASLGGGINFELEDAAGNANGAGFLDVVWQDATNASEDSFFQFQTFVAGSAVDLMRFGGAGGTVALPDVDFTFAVGRCLVDSRTSDTVNFSHRDNTGSTSWAVQFGATGFVGMNALSGSSGALRANNVNKFAWSTTGVSFFNATIAAQQNITGSRSANAALADLLTKLATIGLITDGTTA